MRAVRQALDWVLRRWRKPEPEPTFTRPPHITHMLCVVCGTDMVSLHGYVTCEWCRRRGQGPDPPIPRNQPREW